ncbi:MAG: DUF4340 domain-containing protein [Thermoanaerobaculia bacterium]
MSRTDRYLALAAAVLLLLSVLTYRHSAARADRFERGQKFLPHLNPDEIATIALQKGDEKLTLHRRSNRYTIVEQEGYRARNDAVNRLLRDLLEITLEKEVGEGADLEEELELEPPSESTVELALYAQGEQEMVRLRIGKPQEDGPGNYVLRLDRGKRTIYLTSRSVHLDTSSDFILQKEILDVGRSEIASIEGQDFRLERDEEDELKLADLPPGRQEKSSATGGLKSILSALRFDKVFVADHEEVRDLRFREALRVDLKDGSGYLLSSAVQGDRNFLRIKGFHSVTRVAIAQDESEEELEQKAEVLSRADEIRDFNAYHGSWVYEIGEFTAKKLGLRKRDLIET